MDIPSPKKCYHCPVSGIPSTLFICYGNVARSQMAQGWFNFYTTSTKGSSAGSSPLAQNVFHHPTPEAIAVMQEEGVDISQQPVTALTPQIAQAAQQIVVLCQPSDAPDYVHKHPNVIFYELEDPFGKTIDVYRSVREQIRLFIQTLLPGEG